MARTTGTHLGPYEVQTLLGSGGMGEAKAIAALDHPHICVLHDVGTTKEPTF